MDFDDVIADTTTSMDDEKNEENSKTLVKRNPKFDKIDNQLHSKLPKKFLEVRNVNQEILKIPQDMIVELRSKGLFKVSLSLLPSAKKVLSLMNEFFSLSVEEKTKLKLQRHGGPGGRRGWFDVFKGPEDESNFFSKNTQEGIDFAIPWIGKDGEICENNLSKQNLWPYPDQPGRFKDIIYDFARECLVLTANILRSVALGMGLPGSFFQKHIQKHSSEMRLLHYPPMLEQGIAKSFRCAEHHDFGLLTFLLNFSGGGLERQCADNQWVPVGKNGISVFMGSMMTQWSQNFFPALKHRVTNIDSKHSRYSIVFFFSPDFDTDISQSLIVKTSSDKKPIITCRDWLNQGLSYKEQISCL
eukprot:g14288.t1